VGGKDLILYTIGEIGVDGALYSAMEFSGEAVDMLSMDGRFTMANMAIEAGAKAGIFAVDDRTREYVRDRARRPYKVYEPDRDAEYQRVVEYDVSGLEPQVACPHSPANTRPVSQVAGVEIDRRSSAVAPTAGWRTSGLPLRCSGANRCIPGSAA
jgi:3-isopropylmalate/(R)-2-methylmalate dehydratase large subunit